MLNLIKKALKLKKTVINPPNQNPSTINYAFIPLITTKNYHFKPHPIAQAPYPQQILDYSQIFIQYTARVIIEGRQIFSFRFMHTDQVEKVCLFLLKTVSGNQEFMYMQVKNKIYTLNPDFLRESLDHLQVFNFSFLKFGSEIGYETLPNADMYFFDGKKQIYAIKIERVMCVYNYVDMEVCEVFNKVILCRACNKNNSQVQVIDDPLLPQREKYLCKKCFFKLFIGEDGNLKYENMDYKYI